MMLADAAVIFPIGGVPRKVEFVFDAPVSAVEREQAVLIGSLHRQAGDPADDFDGGGLCAFGAGAAHLEDLRGEGEVDARCTHGCGDDPAGRDPPVGLFMRAVG